MLNSYSYHCPHCSTLLSDAGKVGFRLKTGIEDTIISLNPNPGEYDYEIDPEIDLLDGKLYDFHCPSCDENLHSERFPDFVEIKLRPSDEIEFDVLFARACGKHCTYVMTEDMIEKHGDHPEDLI